MSETSGVPKSSRLLGAGSSALIFLAFTRLLNPASTVLLLDPMYGEYDHVVRRGVGGQVSHLPLRRRRNYDLDPDDLAVAARGADMVVLVNPNSPTGRYVDHARLESALRDIPEDTLIWIDETYLRYVDAAQSLASFAAASSNVIICTSMSKAYALSGARVAHLCGLPALISELNRLTPPWAVGTIGQLAALRALESDVYYQDWYAQTRILRKRLHGSLASLGLDVVPGSANFLLAHLTPDQPDAATIRDRCAETGVYVRDASAMGTTLGDRALRIAVKDNDGLDRVTSSLTAALRG